MRASEVAAWFDRHPFGTLRDSEGDFWRRAIAPKPDGMGYELRRGSEGPFRATLGAILMSAHLSFTVADKGAELDYAQAAAWLRANPARTLVDTDGDTWGIDGDGVLFYEIGSRFYVESIDDFDETRWIAPAPAPAPMAKAAAWAWMSANPGKKLVDSDGDFWWSQGGEHGFAYRLDPDRWIQARGSGELAYTELTFTPAPEGAPSPAPLASLGAAIDWLCAYPGKELVDDDGDRWRLHGTEVQFLGDTGIWTGAVLAYPWRGPWRPYEPPVLPALPAGATWGAKIRRNPLHRLRALWLR